MDILAEACAASRRFGGFTAVSSADLTVGCGEVVGLLGANGAGKTTLIRLLLGLLRPTEGVIRLFGSAPSIAGRRRVGYVPQTLGLYSALTVAENWAFTAAAFRTRTARLPAAVEAYNRAFALLDASGIPVQLQGRALRVGGTASAVAQLLCGAGIDATVTVVPANLEEAFVAMVAGPAPG